MEPENGTNAEGVSFDEAPLYARVISYGVDAVVLLGLWIGIRHWLPRNAWIDWIIFLGCLVLLPVTIFNLSCVSVFLSC